MALGLTWQFEDPGVCGVHTEVLAMPEHVRCMSRSWRGT
jgi:hypothetical protein